MLEGNPHIIPETAMVIAMQEAERAKSRRDSKDEIDLEKLTTAHFPNLRLKDLIYIAVATLVELDETIFRPLREKLRH